MLVCKEFVHLWCAWNQGYQARHSFPLCCSFISLSTKVLPNFTNPEVLFTCPFFLDCMFTLPIKFSGFFCNKDLPGCLLWRKWLCWSCAGRWHWRWCGEACCCSSWESLIKRWSWPCFLTAHRQAEGLLCLSCSFSWICSALKYCFRWCLAQPECCC